MFLGSLREGNSRVDGLQTLPYPVARDAPIHPTVGSQYELDLRPFYVVLGHTLYGDTCPHQSRSPSPRLFRPSRGNDPIVRGGEVPQPPHRPLVPLYLTYPGPITTPSPPPTSVPVSVTPTATTLARLFPTRGGSQNTPVPVDVSGLWGGVYRETSNRSALETVSRTRSSGWGMGFGRSGASSLSRPGPPGRPK